MAWEKKLPKKEIYLYQAPWNIYASAWFQPSESSLDLAVASYGTKFDNQVQIIRLENGADNFTTIAEFDHPYPATKLMCCPIYNEQYSNLLATSSDYLHFFRITEGSGRLECDLILNNGSDNSHCNPITSFDWNENDINLICTCSVDGTCVVWSIDSSKPIGEVNAHASVSGSQLTELFAHDGAVYDIAFSKAIGLRNVFATAGFDGSVRIFDLKNLNTSTMVYENDDNRPITRLSWNKIRTELVAALSMGSNEIIILDVRKFDKPLIALKSHKGDVNAISWSPNSSTIICSGGDDCQTYIWDISSGNEIIKTPEFWYTAGGAINQVHWCSNQNSWIAVSFANVLELLLQDC